MSDPIADMLTRIRNASRAKYSNTIIASSRFKKEILDILAQEGFIKGYEILKNEEGIESLEVEIKYFRKKPVISVMKRMSRPSLRYYVKAAQLRPVRNNMGIAIVSTSQGLMTGRKAKKLNVGGEMICQVW